METTEQAVPMTEADQVSAEAAADIEEQEHHTGVVEFIREAWSQALVAVNATEEEVQKILSRVTGWVEVGPEEARRLGIELSDRMRNERIQLEEGMESAVKKALMPFRIPTRDDVALLDARVTQLEARIDRLISRRTGTRG